MRLIGYKRVSTAGQVRREGLPVQDKRIRTYARTNGHQIIRFETDPGITGTKDEADRPGIMAALKALEAGEADGIIMTDLGRLSRLLTVQEAILAKVWLAGKKVFTVETGEVPQDDVDDPMRTAMRQVMGVFFQLERAMIIKRMRNGRASKAERGGYAYGSPHFGVKSDDGKLVPDDAEQQVIARMRELRDSGAALRQVAAVLNAEGLHPKRGGTWHASTVGRALKRREQGS